jgi:hypothetical protein
MVVVVVVAGVPPVNVNIKTTLAIIGRASYGKSLLNSLPSLRFLAPAPTCDV